MDGNGNGNGNGNGDGHQPHVSPLEYVTQRLGASESELDADPLHAWKNTPVGKPISVEQLHHGLLSVSQIAEAAIDLGVHISADLKQVLEVLPVWEQTVAQLKILNEQVSAMHGTMNNTRREIQSLRDDVKDVQERARLVPAIKDMLKDIILRLPEDSLKD